MVSIFETDYNFGMTMEGGELRTFGSLEQLEAAGSKMKAMQKFKNVIHPSLLKRDPGTSVLSVVPPPELHLLMGAVNWGLEQLYDLMPEDQLKNRMRTKGISVRGYQGGGLDGVNSNLFLKHLNFLFFSVPADAQPVKDMLASLKVFVEGCFGIDLSPS